MKYIYKNIQDFIEVLFQNQWEFPVNDFEFASSDSVLEVVEYCKAHYTEQPDLTVVLYEYLRNPDYPFCDSELALKYLVSGANADSVYAQYWYGYILLYSKEKSQQNVSKAIYYLEKAANKQLPLANYYLGCAYFYDEFCHVNYSLSAKYFKFAMDNGVQQARFAYAFSISERSCYYYDEKQAIAIYEQLEDECKDGLSANNVGVIYGRYDDETSKRKSFEHFLLGTERGNSIAVGNLINCYKKGLGCKQDLSKIYELAKHCVDNGNELQLNTLGECYEYGYGVEKSTDKALEYYLQHYSKFPQDITCLYNLGHLYMSMNDTLYRGLVARGNKVNNYEESLKYYRKVVEEGEKLLSRSEYINTYGENSYISSPYDFYIDTIVKSFKFKKVGQYGKFPSKATPFSQSCNAVIDNGSLKYWDARGMFFVGVYNEIVTKCKQFAVKWYEKASQLNYTNALYNLGRCYEIGNGVEKNVKNAVYYYDKASYNFHSLAAYRLGILYSSSDEIERNNGKAYDCMVSASSGGQFPLNFNGWGFYTKQISLPVVDAVIYIAKRAETHKNPDGTPVDYQIYRTAIEEYRRACATQTVAGANAFLSYAFKTAYLSENDKTLRDDTFAKFGSQCYNAETLKYCAENNLPQFDSIFNNIICLGDLEIVNNTRKVLRDINRPDLFPKLYERGMILGDSECARMYLQNNVESGVYVDSSIAALKRIADGGSLNAALFLSNRSPDDIDLLKCCADLGHEPSRQKLAVLYFDKCDFDNAYKYFNIQVYPCDTFKYSVCCRILGKPFNLSEPTDARVTKAFNIFQDYIDYGVKKFYDVNELRPKVNVSFTSDLLDYAINNNNRIALYYAYLLGNFTDAVTYLGVMMYAVDKRKAERCFRLENTVYSLYNLAFVKYESSQGVFGKKSRKEAIDEMRKLAVNGFPPACRFVKSELGENFPENGYADYKLIVGSADIKKR